MPSTRFICEGCPSAAAFWLGPQFLHDLRANIGIAVDLLHVIQVLEMIDQAQQLFGTVALHGARAVTVRFKLPEREVQEAVVPAGDDVPTEVQADES